jgi:hypothetical protein
MSVASGNATHDVALHRGHGVVGGVGSRHVAQRWRRSRHSALQATRLVRYNVTNIVAVFRSSSGKERNPTVSLGSLDLKLVSMPFVKVAVVELTTKLRRLNRMKPIGDGSGASTSTVVDVRMLRPATITGFVPPLRYNAASMRMRNAPKIRKHTTSSHVACLLLIWPGCGNPLAWRSSTRSILTDALTSQTADHCRTYCGFLR